MSRDALEAAEIANDRYESDVDEDEAERHWEAQAEWMRGYYEARMPQEIEGEI